MLRRGVAQTLLGFARGGPGPAAPAEASWQLVERLASGQQACSSSSAAGPDPPAASTSQRPPRDPWTPTRELDKRKAYPKRMRHLITVSARGRGAPVITRCCMPLHAHAARCCRSLNTASRPPL